MDQDLRKGQRKTYHTLLRFFDYRWRASVSCCWLYFFVCCANSAYSALVSPWIENGDALMYVKRHDNLLNYRKLVIPLLPFLPCQTLMINYRSVVLRKGSRFSTRWILPSFMENWELFVFFPIIDRNQNTQLFPRKRFLSGMKDNLCSRTLPWPRHVSFQVL